MTPQDAVAVALAIETLFIAAVARPDVSFAEVLEDDFEEVDEVQDNLDTIVDLCAQFAEGAFNQKDFRLLLQRILLTVPFTGPGRKANFNPYTTQDTYYVQLKKVDNRTVEEFEADDGANIGMEGEFYASGTVVTLPAERAELFAGIFHINEDPRSGTVAITLGKEYGDKNAALKAMRGLNEALNGGSYARETMPIFTRMLGKLPMRPSRFASVKRLVARYKAAAATLPSALKQKVNQALVRAGMDGNRPWPRLGQALNEIGDVLAKNGLGHDTMSADRFRGTDGSARLDIEFTNEADPFSPTPITNSILVVTYHQFEETGRWEVIAYLS